MDAHGRTAVMADETPATPIETAAAAEQETIVSAFTPEGDSSPAPGQSDDEILSAALDDDTDNPAPVDEVPAPTTDAKADAPTAGADAAARGFEVLITQKGFTVAQAKALLEKNPEFVNEVGQASLDLEAEAAGAEPEAPADPADPEDEAEKTDEKPEPITDEALVAEIAKDLGTEFDAKEAAALSKAIARAIGARTPTAQKMPDVAAEVQKAVKAQADAMAQHIARVDAQVSEMAARTEIGKLAEVHPELKDEDGVAKVFASANRLVKVGAKFNTMGELMEAAATVAFSATRTAEAKQYRARVDRHRENGVPTTPGVRAGSGKPKDRDDLVLEMAFEGRTQEEIENELARM